MRRGKETRRGRIWAKGDETNDDDDVVDGKKERKLKNTTHTHTHYKHFIDYQLENILFSALDNLL